MTNDMTKGSPIKLILSFMVPLLIGNIFQQFYNMADTIIVGRTISVEALAAVGATGSISFLIVGFVQGVTSGFAVITAQRFGAGSENGVRRSVATSIILGIAVTIVMTAISVLAARPLLEIMKTPSDIIDDSYNYIIVIFEGIAAAVFFNLFSSILRSLGDSKTPLYFLIFSSILNVVLDYVFIKFTNMGVMGAAVATVLAQLLSVIFCFVVILKNFKIIRLKKDDFKFSSSLFKNMMGAGMTMAVMNSIFSIGSIIMQGSINALGDDIIAAHLGSRKVAEMFMQPLVTIGTACSTFVGQNYGAGKIKRIKSSIKYSTLYSLIWSVFTFFVLWF